MSAMIVTYANKDKSPRKFTFIHSPSIYIIAGTLSFSLLSRIQYITLYRLQIIPRQTIAHCIGLSGNLDSLSLPLFLSFSYTSFSRLIFTRFRTYFSRGYKHTLHALLLWVVAPRVYPGYPGYYEIDGVT